jgi:hypothetical protein
MEVSLADGSQRLLNNLGIIIKPFPGGFHLLTSDPELLESENQSGSFSLFLNCTDPFYINYTELPLYNLADKLLYFNNLSDVKIEGEKGFVLHSKEFAGENELVQVVHKKVSISGFKAGEKYRFTDAAGNEITSQNIAPSLQNSATFNISNLPQGLILFYPSGKKEVKKFYHYPKAVWRKPFAVVELFPGEIFNQFKDKGKVEYAINFSNRKTIWKYFLVSPVYKNFKNLNIINKGKELVFNSPQKQLINKNYEALVFESKSKIPLAEQSDENFQLVDNYDAANGKGKPVLKNLAKASPEQLYRDETKSNEFIYSHIFI